MAASSSRGCSSDSPGGWRQLTESVYEVHIPTEGYIDLEVVFLHGFVSKSDTDSYYRTWMKADGSANWLDTWFAETFPRTRILSVSYDSSLITSPSTGRFDIYLLGESLMQSLVDLAGVGRTCPVVLVGHCVGGMVLKKIALSAETSANRERRGSSLSRPYVKFLKNMKGAFFLSTPSLGANLPITNWLNQGGPLLKNLELLGTESARINAAFAKLRRKWEWITYGVFAANETETTKFLQYFYDIGGSDSELDSAPRYLCVVPEASARADMDDFGVIPEVDHFTICQSSDSFAHLISFLTKIKTEEAQNAMQLKQSFGLHSKIMDLDDRLKSVIAKLQLEKPEPLGLALVGIDGIGKSTLAKQVVNTIRHQFEYVCLVELENLDRSRRSRMLEMLVAQTLLYSNGRRVQIDEGEQPWGHIRGKKVLMVVDDVHSEDEISQLFRMDWCGKGSRLVITSSRQDWGRHLIVHQVPLLSEEASHELLASHLDEFTLKSMPKKMVSQVVDECAGLPLVLEVIGKYLWDKREVRIWLGALKRLQMADSLDGSAEENIVWKKIKVSFDSLGKLEKQVFLDVATFDLYPTCETRYDLEIFRSAWGAELDEELIDVALINLDQRSFLSLVEGKNSDSIVHAQKREATLQVFSIHKQIRAMAAWISGPDKENLEDRRSIWQLQNVTDLLTNCSKVSVPRTEVLSISVERKSHVDTRPQVEMIRSLQWGSLGSLKVLRLLRISHTHMLGADKLTFPTKLALLHMEDCTREPQKENWWLPWSLRDLSSWPLCDENIEELGALSVLIFRNCSFLQLPQSFYKLRCLKILQIHNDGRPMGPLPENIGLLPALKHLSLSVSLKRLPNSLLQLPSLQCLVLSGECLQAWPIPITVDPYCHLTALRTLELTDLPALTELPDTFGGLVSLNHLTIEQCPALEKLPEGFGALSELRVLEIWSCSKLETLCESFGSLSQLRRLSLHHLPKLRMLPVTIGNLPSLEQMDLNTCHSIKDLSESFATLQSVLQVKIHDCHGLEALWPDSKYRHVNQGLENLCSLYVYGCSKLQGLPKSFERLKSLKQLTVHDCGKFRYRPETLLQFTSLTTLDIAYAAMPMIGITSSDDGERESLEVLQQISSLCPSGSTDSEIKLPTSTGLPNPSEELEAHSSKRAVGAFDSVTHLPGLKWLVPQDDQYMNNPPESPMQQSSSTSSSVENSTQSAGVHDSEVRHLPDLQELSLWDCEFTSTFRPQLVSLKELSLHRCRGVAHVLETMTMWTGMQQLCIEDCQAFSSLPDTLGNLSLLTRLKLVECQDLVCLPQSIGQLSSLIELTIHNCKKLRCLPESLRELRNICSVDLENCESISNLPNLLGNPTSLTELMLVDCQGLVTLPESIGQLISLRALVIKNCSGLTCLPVSLCQLRNLESLHIENCRSILSIPDSVYHMTWLRYLRIFDCRTFESEIVRNLKEFTRLETLGLSTWNKLMSFQEFMGSVQLETFQLPMMFGLVVKCMDCEDTLVPLEKEEVKFLRDIDDSCGCIHTIGFLKCVGRWLSPRGPLQIELYEGRSEHLDFLDTAVTVVCGRVKANRSLWRLRSYSFIQ